MFIPKAMIKDLVLPMSFNFHLRRTMGTTNGFLMLTELGNSYSTWDVVMIFTMQLILSMFGMWVGPQIDSRFI